MKRRLIMDTEKFLNIIEDEKASPLDTRLAGDAYDIQSILDFNFHMNNEEETQERTFELLKDYQRILEFRLDCLYRSQLSNQEQMGLISEMQQEETSISRDITSLTKLGYFDKLMGEK